MAERLGSLLFTPVASQPVRVFRVALAAMLAFSFWPRGIAPSSGVLRSPFLLDLHENIILTPGYWVVVVALLVVFASGWRPRLVGVVLLVMLYPLTQLDRGRQSRHILFVTLACFSLLRSGERSLRTAGAGPIWPIQLIRFQLTFLYGINAIWKLTPHYLSGDALVGMSERLPNFRVDFSDGYWHVGSLAIPVAVAAVASTLTEAFLAVAFWFPRVRRIAAVVGIAFHIVLQQIVSIFMLDLASMFLYLAFLLPFERNARQPSAVESVEGPSPSQPA